jgi:hypothetical protein
VYGNKSLIVTAAHCLSNGKATGLKVAEGIIFRPGWHKNVETGVSYTGGTQGGWSSAPSRALFFGGYNTNATGDERDKIHRAYDFTFVRLRKKYVSGAWRGLHDYIGAYPIMFSYNRDRYCPTGGQCRARTYRLTGYPNEGSENVAHVNLDGSSLWTCFGNYAGYRSNSSSAVSRPPRIYAGCGATYRGASGGAWGTPRPDGKTAIGAVTSASHSTVSSVGRHIWGGSASHWQNSARDAWRRARTTYGN